MVATGSELIALLEREAAAEREQILNEARAQADDLRARATQEADEFLSTTRSRLEAEARTALVKARSTAHLRASALVLQAKEEELARVFAAAEQELAAFVRDPQRYRAALCAFIEEGRKGFSGGEVVTVNPSDVSVVQELLRTGDGEVTVQADPAVEGGVRVSSPDGRFVVTNTVRSRFERAKPALAAEVAKILWE